MTIDLLFEKQEAQTESFDNAPHPIPDPAPITNYYLADRHLQLLLARYLEHDPAGRQWVEAYLEDFGATCAQQIAPLYEQAEKNIPVLKQFNRRGERVDEVVFHPAYHQIGQLIYGKGLTALTNVPNFDNLGTPASNLVKFAAFYLYYQADGSIGCPASMTDILARVLIKFASPELQARYLPHLTSLNYDQLYTGAMFMTEKTGGSDVGATTTVAYRVGDDWELSGDKWFCSNVSADVILTLARPEGARDGTRGLGLFVVPKILPDGSRNSYTINRLKDKLGTRAMASGEVTLNRAKAFLIEPLERGFVMMMEMVNGTRLHTGFQATGIFRRAVVEATLHANERKAFGRTLAEQPLFAEQLADLIVDCEACVSLGLATAALMDKSDAPDATREDQLLARFLITFTKRYNSSRGVDGAKQSLEMRGGNGYIEDWPNARLLRDAMVQVIWEGGINIVSFDVLRTLSKEQIWPVFEQAVTSELAKITSPALSQLVTELHQSLQELGEKVAQLQYWQRAAQEIAAPQLTETFAALYAAVMLVAQADYCQGRSPQDALRSLQTAQRYHQRFLQPSLLKLAKFEAEPSSAVSNLIKGALI